MVECCGKPRRTPFCPQCGKRMRDDLHSLRHWLAAHNAKAGSRHAVRLEQWIEAVDGAIKLEAEHAQQQQPQG